MDDVVSAETASRKRAATRLAAAGAVGAASGGAVREAAMEELFGARDSEALAAPRVDQPQRRLRPPRSWLPA